MGHDKMSVVDSNLKVHNINKLRIVDASIMPEIVSGNTNASAYMIGEMGAKLILDENLGNKKN
jgi:choline dehydrogenase